MKIFVDAISIGPDNVLNKMSQQIERNSGVSGG